MLEIPEEIKDLFRADNLDHKTQKRFKLTFYNDEFETLYPYETLFPDEGLFPSEHGEAWLVIENDRIESESLVITEALSETEDLEFGSCESAMMEIIVADVIEDVTDREFTLTVEIGGYEMVMGVYTVESFVRQADRRKRKITAYDRMRRFDTDVSTWYNELRFPMTLRAFRDALCSYIGIVQSGESLPFDDMQLTKTIEPTQISGRDVLQAVCQLNGCFGHIDRTGQLVYVRLQTTGLYPSEDLFPYEELYPSEFGGDGEAVEVVSTYKELTYEDYVVEGITGISIRQEDGDIGANVGDGENPYAIEGNFLVYGKSATDLLAIAATALSQIVGRSYRPAVLDCNAMPWIEVGDALRIITRDDIVETFVMKRTTKGCQSMRDQCESTGSKRREEVFGINKQIIQLEGKTAVITKNVEEVSVRVTDLKNYTEAEFKVTNDKINLKVSKGEVSSQLSLEPDKVTLKSNRLIVDSTNFKLDGNGNATFSGTVQSAAIKSSAIEGGSININNIFKVDTGGNTSITGNNFSWSATNSSMTRDGTLNCKNITATGGTFTGTVSGGAISGSAISGANISGSSLNSSTINVQGFSVDDDLISLGDFYVTQTQKYILGCTSGMMTLSGGKLTGSGEYRYPIIELDGPRGRSFLSDASLGVATTASIGSFLTVGEVYPQDPWWDGWSLTRTCADLYDKISSGSDRTIKHNIIDIDKDEALAFILGSRPTTFQYNDTGLWSAGFIAQEVDELQDKLGVYFPLVRFDERNKKLRIDYYNYIPILTACIQNMQEEIEELKGKAGIEV